jgi:hypothetical protein
VDRQVLELMGIRHVIEVDSVLDPDSGALFEPHALVRAVERMIEVLNSRGAPGSRAEEEEAAVERCSA